MRLTELASVIRSKNAGPRVLTLDLIFPDAERFAAVQAAEDRLRAEVARAYGRPVEEVSVIVYPPANAIKIALRRDIMAGDPDDSDVYGAQQHAPLMEITL
jgi:hypothetical protein